MEEQNFYICEICSCKCYTCEGITKKGIDIHRRFLPTCSICYDLIRKLLYEAAEGGWIDQEGNGMIGVGSYAKPLK